MLPQNPPWPHKLIARMPLPFPAGVLILGLALTGALALGAYLDGSWSEFVRNRAFFVTRPVILIIYLLIATRYASLGIHQALLDLRPVVAVSDAEYQALITIPAGWRDLLPVVIGIALGLTLGPALQGGPLRPLFQSESAGAALQGGPGRTGLLSIVIENMVQAMVGIGMAWLAFWTIQQGLLVSRLHRYPFNLNIFDPEPLLPVYLIARNIFLVFIGLSTLTLLLSMDPRGQISLRLDRLAVNLVFLILALGILFLIMWQTHRKMVRAKKQELSRLRASLMETYQELQRRKEQGALAEMEELSDMISAFLSYEKRIEEAPVWPFSTGVMRQVAFSTAAPLGTWLYEAFLGPLLFGK
ncbi:MAG: hypothetical protein HY326_06120 [Chloroflexi bacterium]|nr:hypothetical protein [Chloroflexota bacterium]